MERTGEGLQGISPMVGVWVPGQKRQSPLEKKLEVWLYRNWNIKELSLESVLGAGGRDRRRAEGSMARVACGLWRWSGWSWQGRQS